MSNKVVNLRSGHENKRCSCGSEWWDAAVVFDRFWGCINAYAKVSCRECGEEMRS